MEEDKFYHIYNRANGHENLFRQEKNYPYFLQQWAKYINPIAETYAYCLMPNHFHFLIKIRKEEELLKVFNNKLKSDLSGFQNLTGLISKQFSNLFNSYSKASNKLYSRNGSLFQRPFKAKEIISDAYLTRIVFYIHHNPVHHGFIKTMAGWPHSSFQAMLSTKNTALKRNYILEWFGGKGEFQLFHKQNIKNLQSLENEFT